MLFSSPSQNELRLAAIPTGKFAEPPGDRIADIYEAGMDTTSTVDLLAELAGKGRALALGIGTGRVAVPLAARGVQVEGIDASEAMVEKLRQRPGGPRPSRRRPA
jgi:2-polyprenyl-3-methyl-5-hydroxy-6-metoxy-1,4-benzoquinol methylase